MVPENATDLVKLKVSADFESVLTAQCSALHLVNFLLPHFHDYLFDLAIQFH